MIKFGMTAAALAAFVFTGQAATAADQKGHAQSDEHQVVRFTETTDMQVKTKDDEPLGSIIDLMVDTESHEIAYTVLSRGDVLGVGGKRFAVPMDAYESREKEGEKYLVVDATPAQLETLNGIRNEGDYPAKARDDWSKKDIDASGEDYETAAEADLLPATTLVGIDVRNESNEIVGSISDLVYDYESGDVKYLAFTHGGVAGIGSTTCAVPCDDFQLTYEGDEKYLRVNIRAEELEYLKGFQTDGEWPNEADEDWKKNREPMKKGA